MNECEKYLINFLSQGIPELEKRIAYIKMDEEIPDGKDIIIIKSNFFEDGIFGSKDTEPRLPLSLLNGIPILYGEPEIKKLDAKTVIYADLIASAFFLITRYEEIINKDRDEFGRFPGKKSVPYLAGFIHRPIVDEYTALLKKIAGIEDDKYCKRLCLTHDIDSPYTHFNLFTAIRKTVGDIVRKRPISTYQYQHLVGKIKDDPKYIFDRMIKTDLEVSDNQVIYFVKSGGNIKPYDDYIYIKDKAWRQLSDELLQSGAEIGFHSSFEAAENPEVFYEELKLLERIQKTKVTKHRSHYLRSMEPDSFNVLINAGITDDYTMGYADIAGFRLGTARNVLWIDPKSKKLTSLVLHPMIAMDSSLIGKNYMNLSVEEAILYLKGLIDTSGYGTPSVIWHNHIMYNTSELETIYNWLIGYLKA